MKLKTLAITLGALLLSFSLVAQTAAEIETAKNIARSYGYSDSEINAMMNKQQAGGGAAASAQAVPQVARTVTTAEVAAGFDVTAVGSSELKAGNTGIYGHDIFKSPDLNFVPSYNMPTPADYKLASGDEIVIDLWGAVYMNITQTISPEGSITIPDLGPIYLTGQTINQAEKLLKSHLSRIYSGIAGEKPTTFLRLSLGRIRSFTINVVGDVERPGTYTLPSLSTVFSSLYLSGGPTSIGSVRDVKVYRNNKLYKSFDVYDFIVDGDFSANIRLEDNDLIKVEPYINLVSINGKVKRPMTYEIKDGETVQDILYYAGGFAKDANVASVHLTRVRGDRKESYDIAANKFASFELTNGDAITVRQNIEENRNIVTIQGPVWHPGSYALSDTLTTLKQLIKSAGGIKEETYLKRGYIERLNEKRVKVSLHFSVEDVLNGTEEVMLMNNDDVRLFTNDELVNRTLIYVAGEVNKPSEFVYRPGMTLGDALLLSGGFTVGAALSNIDVARRNFNDGDKHESDTIATVFNFDLITNPEANDFPLEPYDAVFVRVAPNYKKQQRILVEGEVIFPGSYVVEKNVVRLSDIVNRAGGFNQDAYVKGAVLVRQLTDEEYERTYTALRFAQEKVGDSATFSASDLQRSYTIGIDLQKAMAQPGSYSDIILREGDVIRVPKMNNTVKITGGVLYKNVVSYDPDLTVKDYVAMSGGYIKKAKKSGAYIVYMNGTVATRKSKGGLKVEPGCEIVIPVKDDSNKRPMTTAEIMSIATSTASLATMIVSMINILK